MHIGAAADVDHTSERSPIVCVPGTKKHRVMRRRLKLPDTAFENITFTLLQTPDDLRSVCQLLHTSYTDAGYIVADRSGYRFTPYFALPNCYTLLAKSADRVVGTLTLIVRQDHALPVESIFSLAGILGEGRTVAEISCLAVAPRYRTRRQELILLLLKYMMNVGATSLRITDLVLTCNPKHIDFYLGICMMEPIEAGRVVAHDYVDGAPAMAARGDLANARTIYRTAYAAAPPERDWGRFVFETEPASMHVPRAAERVIGNRWSEFTLGRILKRFAQGRSRLGASDMQMLRASYGPTYQRVFDAYEGDILVTPSEVGPPFKRDRDESEPALA